MQPLSVTPIVRSLLQLQWRVGSVTHPTGDIAYQSYASKGICVPTSIGPGPWQWCQPTAAPVTHCSVCDLSLFGFIQSTRRSSPYPSTLKVPNSPGLAGFSISATMAGNSLALDGPVVPSFLYGCAEKPDPSVILAALNAGYRGIDSACQPQFYDEKAIGQAIASALSPVSGGGLGLKRRGLFVQTKFTTPAGHKPHLAPYLGEDLPEVKVRKSLDMSLAKLGVDYVDCLLLHGPMPTLGETLEIWAGMESVCDKVLSLGLSNVSLEQLEAVYNHATIKPAIVQNRFWYHNHFDSAVRSFCAENNIVYQAFWVLTGNPQLLDSNFVGWLAERVGASREDTLFSLVLSLGQDGPQVSVLNGTTNPERMLRSLEVVRRMGEVPEFVRQGFVDELDSLAKRLKNTSTA